MPSQPQYVHSHHIQPIDTIGFAPKHKSQRQVICRHSGEGIGFEKGEAAKVREVESCTPEG